MLIKFSKFIGKDVRVRHKVKVLLAVFLLHPDHVEAESVFSSDFVTLGKVIDFLVLVEPFVEVAFAARGAPKNVPLVGLGGREASSLEHRPNKFIVKSKHFVQQFAVLNVVSFLVTVELHCVCHHLLLGNILEDEEVRIVLVVVVV